jgi:hypothetical protein
VPDDRGQLPRRCDGGDVLATASGQATKESLKGAGRPRRGPMQLRRACLALGHDPVW